MADILPSVLFPSYASDGTNITIPLADLPGLTAAEADAATGDGREVARNLVKVLVANVLALDPSLAPTEMIVSKSNPVSQGQDTVRITYSLGFDIGIDTDAATMTPEA